MTELIARIRPYELCLGLKEMVYEGTQWIWKLKEYLFLIMDCIN